MVPRPGTVPGLVTLPQECRLQGPCPQLGGGGGWGCQQLLREPPAPIVATLAGI